MVLVHAPVGEDKNVRAVAIRSVAIYKEPVKRLFERSIFIIEQRYCLRLKSLFLHVPDFHQVNTGENRVVDFEHTTVLRLLNKQITVRTNIHRCVRDNFLSESVDRRVGNLSKQLLEVVKKRSVFLREHRKGHIAAHGRSCFVARLCHGQNRVDNLLIGVSENLVQLVALFLGIVRNFLVRHRQIGESYKLGVEPLTVWLTARIVFLAFLIGDNLLCHGVHKQHFARAQTRLKNDILRRNIKYAHF